MSDPPVPSGVPVLVDSNILLDVALEAPQWLEWSAEALPAPYFRREPLPWHAAFLAGKAFLQYRRARGTGPSPLPDFHIGAHAAVCGYALLTREAARSRTYFPGVPVVALP